MSKFPDCIVDCINVDGLWIPPSQVELPKTYTEIYEIMRIIEGVPIFLEDHLDRFLRSAEILKIDLHISIEHIKNQIDALISKYAIQIGNLKFAYLDAGNEYKLIVYATKYNYPPSELYNIGVETGLLRAERQHPNAKDVQPIREITNKFIAENGYYEAILVSDDNTITEGSKSNLFFQKGTVFITAPANHVLLGITRKYVMQSIVDCGFTLEEREFHLDELPSIDGAFISGTSPKVLPICSIDKMLLSVPTKEQISIIKRYDEILKDHIFTAKLDK